GEAVVQPRGGPLGAVDGNPLSARRSRLDYRCAQRVRSLLVAAPGVEQDGEVCRRQVPRRGGDRLRLMKKLLGQAELSAKDLVRGAVGPRERKNQPARALAAGPPAAAPQRFAPVRRRPLTREL